MATDARRSQWDQGPGLLVKAAFKRGYQRSIDVPLILVGLIPAAFLQINHAPGFESAPSILATFWAGPTVLLLAWTPFDPEGQAGREINMWFEAVVKTTRRFGADSPALSAFETASVDWDGRPLGETARALRTTLSPMVHGRLPLRFWVFEARFFWPLFWSVISIVVLGLFLAGLALSPECASHPDTVKMCR